jgi:hypothetical protein
VRFWLKSTLRRQSAAAFAAIARRRAEPHWPSGQFNRGCGLLVSVVDDDLTPRKSDRPRMETQNRGVAGDPNVIKLRARDIAQLFNTLDASPFRIRDISPAVGQYIVDWAQELPQGQPIKLMSISSRAMPLEEKRQTFLMHSGLGILRKRKQKQTLSEFCFVTASRSGELCDYRLSRATAVSATGRS